ncbi:MAG: hypothetical protein WC222_11545 [Parachlamydiales bacterium]|jgi:hypothetical protein
MTAIEMKNKALVIIKGKPVYIFEPMELSLYNLQLLLDYELYMDIKMAEKESPVPIVPYCIEEFLTNQS